MKVHTTDFDKIIGFNPSNEEKPFYLLNAAIVIIEDDKKQTNALNKRYIRLEQGFESDGCSIPKVFQIVLGCSHEPKYTVAAIIHDWIVEHPTVVNRDRNYSSRVLLTLLLQNNVPKWKAYRMFLGVELWQWLSNPWKKRWK